jgi:hypothetical protein
MYNTVYGATIKPSNKDILTVVANQLTEHYVEKVVDKKTGNIVLKHSLNNSKLRTYLFIKAGKVYVSNETLYDLERLLPYLETYIYSLSSRGFIITGSNLKTVTLKACKASFKSLYLDMIDVKPEYDIGLTREEIDGVVYQSSRTVDTGCAAFKYLKSVIAECTEAVVSHREVFKPSALPFTALTEQEAYTHMVNYSLLTKVQPVRNELFKVATTVEQYRAIHLLQSYTKWFDSCQYLPLHRLTRKAVKAYLQSGLLSTGIKLGSMIDLDITKDFTRGLASRYFQMAEDGTILRRFTVYKLKVSHGSKATVLRASNFYNMSNLDVTIKGIPVSTTFICGLVFSGKTYFNPLEPRPKNIYLDS